MADRYDMSTKFNYLNLICYQVIHDFLNTLKSELNKMILYYRVKVAKNSFADLELQVSSVEEPLRKENWYELEDQENLRC